jgi:uncharacterized protein (TIGR02171 family)
LDFQRIGIATAIAGCGLVAGCFVNDDKLAKPDIVPIQGMLPLRSAEKPFQMGSSGLWAAPNEAPVMQLRLTYDFQMDSTEVTQAAFSALMGRDPVAAPGTYGKGGAFPVYNVSWFDAALFCNARSKASGLDTVYAYSRIEQAPGGGVYNLPGLAVRLEKRGFRLPTEAEWEFAAHGGLTEEFPWGPLSDSGKAAEFAWYSGNAEGRSHPVAGLRPNGFGLFDMAGNVMEWVNDWKGRYPSGVDGDFAGARDPGPEFDAPVKGGSFKFGIRELRPAGRSVTYTTIRSATAEYVGFRCALGAIAHPRFSTADGNLAGTDPVSLEINRFQSLVGGRAAKLVFVNAGPDKRQLAYVDYRRYPPRVVEFGDIGNVFYPVISPDGAWVAFGTALEGAVDGSSIYIRELKDSAGPARLIGPGFIPRWWVDPASRDTFLVYANSASDNSQAQWAGSKTLQVRIQGGAPTGAPIALVPDGGFHDGRSQDGRWLATGFRLLKVRDGLDGAIRTHFTAPGNGKEANDTSQVCNVSVAPDASGRTLFLDFGYEGISNLTGSFYDIHQIAFMSDPQGAVLKWFRAPPSINGWEDLEWTNHPDFAVSASTDALGRHRQLYLLNLRDSAYTLIASGTSLATPGLWLGGAPDSIPTNGLDLDSLGWYDVPATDDYQSIFASRIATFWKRHATLEVIFTGSSHVFGGIDPSKITRYQSLNMGYPAAGRLGQEEWVANYALNHCPKLKVMVMEAFPGWLKYPGGDFTWIPKISATKGMRYDRSHGYWKDGLPFGFESLVKRSPQSILWDGDSLGFHFEEAHGWGTDPVKPEDSEWDLRNPEYAANMKATEDFARVLAGRGIHLVMVNYPTSPAYAGNAYYGPYGPRATVAAEIIKRYKDMEKISPYVHFYDAHDFGHHDYSDEEAINWGHLSSTGAAKLTARLDSLINGLADVDL